MAKVKFKDLSKNQKIFRIVNLSFMALQLLALVGILIWQVLRGDPDKRLVPCIGVMIGVVAPYLIELIFRTRIPNLLFLGIQIYLAFAGLFGSALNGYNTFAWLDVVVHVIMGYFCAMLGVFIISRVTDYKKISPWAVVLFCFFFALGVELVWEMLERFADLFLGQTAQGPKVDGTNAPLVTDTIEDLLCNFSGALAFFVQFVIGKFSKFSFGVKAIEEELAKGVKEVQKNENNETENVETVEAETAIKQENKVIEEPKPKRRNKKSQQ